MLVVSHYLHLLKMCCVLVFISFLDLLRVVLPVFCTELLNFSLISHLHCILSMHIASYVYSLRCDFCICGFVFIVDVNIVRLF